MLRRLLAWEWLHWSTRRDVRIAVAGLLLGGILWSWLGAIAVQSELVPAFLSGSEATGFALAYRSMQGLTAFLTLFVLLWSAASIAAELEAGQLRQQLLRVRRVELLCSKALHLWLVSSAILLLLLLSCLLVGALHFGLRSVHVGPILVHSTSGLALSGLAAFGLATLPLAAIIALGVAISASSGGSRAATMLTLCAVAILWALGQTEPLRRFDFVGALSRPWGVALAQAEGLRTSSHGDGLTPLLLSCTIVSALCLSGAIWHFERRDLK